jgi:hypothetical protein
MRSEPMTEKPDKPESAGRTTNTPFRLTEEDKRRLEVIRRHFAYWDRIDAVRHAMDVLYRQVDGEPPLEKSPSKYVRDS